MGEPSQPRQGEVEYHVLGSMQGQFPRSIEAYLNRLAAEGWRVVAAMGPDGWLVLERTR